MNTHNRFVVAPVAQSILSGLAVARVGKTGSFGISGTEADSQRIEIKVFQPQVFKWRAMWV